MSFSKALIAAFATISLLTAAHGQQPSNAPSSDQSAQTQPAKPSPEIPAATPQNSTSTPASAAPESSSPSSTPGQSNSQGTSAPDPVQNQPQTPAQNPTPAQVQTQSAPAAPSATSFNEVIDRMVEREHFFVAQMRHMHPLVETYIQNMRPDQDMGSVPTSDHYFLGRLDLSNGTDDRSFLTQPGFRQRFMGKLTSLYSMKFLPLGFAQMSIIDSDLQKQYYDFKFVRREFLGEVRCFVIDIQPKAKATPGRFVGRVWVEDQEYNIVRANGTYSSHPRNSVYLHFDSWRINMRQGLWLPAYIYSEESNSKVNSQTLNFKAQTRLWGYDLQHLGKHDEFTQIVVDSPQSVKDQSETAQDASPVQAQRNWERQAEDNALERLQTVGLLAPEGDVDKVLTTVVNNLEVTNNLDVQPEVRCRVLLTAPLESFDVGHTIVISRGLLDVLPDEASLAMVLAHELGHIVLGHKVDTNLAFSDRMLFPDDETFTRFSFNRSPEDEDAADKRALEMLKNSPYKDKLANAGLFLRALQDRGPVLKSLIKPHLGNGLASSKELRMSDLLGNAPALDAHRTDQIAALPLGGRIKLDSWSNRVEMVKTKPVALLSPREKMAFQVTPFFPYLTRLGSPNAAEKAALDSPAK
jgi:Peptidase family M48